MESLREKLARKKREREELLSNIATGIGPNTALNITSSPSGENKSDSQDNNATEQINPVEVKRRKSSSESYDYPEKSDSSPLLADEEVDIQDLLSMSSAREREHKKFGEEIRELLSRPTAKERDLVEKFRSANGKQVREFCAYGTRDDCIKRTKAALLSSKKSKSQNKPELLIDQQLRCPKLHFKKIIQRHTDESLGDCSFLNTCFHRDICKYVHYEVDYADYTSGTKSLTGQSDDSSASGSDRRLQYSIRYPPQWIECDLRFFDMSILGKFSVIMADPPWDIHMELPYGTMSDDEMRKLNIPILQDEGLIFLWVTGRAMELGRECLTLWGYKRVEEIIWVKTNQLQRIIRTGRTGHWLNHGKEHCLVGIKGNPPNINRGLDCDVIVAEVRATSHKPDEIYGIIERLSPGSPKIELFGRPHNCQYNWLTLGNQLQGYHIVDPDLKERYEKYSGKTSKK